MTAANDIYDPTPLLQVVNSIVVNACGTFSPSIAYVSSTWLANLNAFFADIKASGIKNVTITPAHTGFGGDVTISTTWKTSPNNNMGCAMTPKTLTFWAAAPYGNDPSNGGRPADQGNNQAYNCSPANPIFIGWTNLGNVINAMITSGTQNKLTVYELDVEQELDFLNFTPNIVDVHDYACVSSGGCLSSDSGANVAGEARIDFTDLLNYFADEGQSPGLVILGETQSNTRNPPGSGTVTCEGVEIKAPAEMVAGYNQSAFAGRPIVFRPWLNLADNSVLPNHQSC